MKYSVLAARRQIAIERIVTEMQRQGVSLTVPAARGDVEHQQLALLEAIAEALAGINPTEGAKLESGKTAEVEPVEAVISVVSEPAEEEPKAKPAPKKPSKA